MPEFSLSSRLTLLALLTSSSVYLLIKSRLLHKLPLLLLPTSCAAASPADNPNPNLKVFAFSQTGTSLSLARRLLALLPGSCLIDPCSYEPDDFLAETFVLFVASTWEDGGPPEGSRYLFDYIEECAADFRVGRALEGNCRFAVFGVGSSGYGEERFNKVGKDLRRWLKELGAEEVVEFGAGDVDEGSVDEVFDEWSRKLVRASVKGDANGMANGGSRVGMWEEGDGDEEGGDSDKEVEDEIGVVDMEDVAGKWVSSRKDWEGNGNGGNGDGKKAMVTPVIRAGLEKQV